MKFGPGDIHSCLIVDGIESTPWLAATLRYDAEQGVELEIPYVSRIEQFEEPSRWFRSKEFPANLQVTTIDGAITLFDCQLSRHTENLGRGTAFGTLSPQNVVLMDRDGSFADDLSTRELRSRIDGLRHWSQFSAIKRTVHHDEGNRATKLVMEAEAVDSIEWRHGNFVMSIDTAWRENDNEDGFQVDDSVLLRSCSTQGSPIDAHIREQRKILNLLTVLFGQGMNFRGHSIRDPRFTSKLMEGGVYDMPYVELFSRSTLRDFNLTTPKLDRSEGPLVGLDVCGVTGLERWNACHDTWKRVIYPIVGLLSRSHYVEDSVVSGGIALEAASSLLGKIREEESTYNGKRKTMATHVFRALSSLPVDWTSVAESTQGLSRAVADTYNSMKHFDRGEFPDPVHSYLFGKLSVLLARLVLASQLVSSDAAKSFAECWPVQTLLDEFRAHDIYVDRSGNIGRRTINQGESP
jgi:hypothetical protein